MSELKQLEKDIKKLQERVKAIEKELKEAREIAEYADSKAGDVEDDLENLTAVVDSLIPEEENE